MTLHPNTNTNFEMLVATIDRLLGPNGCSWDREQTLKSLRKYVLEEVCEVIDAINAGRGDALCEELGDLFYNVLFLSKLAEKEGFFPWDAPIFEINQKIIRRYPHVFDKANTSLSSEEVAAQWDAIKKLEKKLAPSPLVPQDLPALARAEKLLSIEKKKRGENASRSDKPLPDFSTEEELGNYLLDLVAKSKSSGLHAESALRHTCRVLESEL